jgi:catechol 2,3-dioxygenase-like lactoylglutathione lyase family enzyme
LFAFEKLHHVAIPANDFARLHAFYTGVLGLQAHPEKPNWLRAGDGFSVHLMTSKTKPGSARVEQHFALPVDSLHGLLAHLWLRISNLGKPASTAKPIVSAILMIHSSSGWVSCSSRIPRTT